MEKSNISALLSVSLGVLVNEFGLDSSGPSEHALNKTLNTIGKKYWLVTFGTGVFPDIEIFIAFTLFVAIFPRAGFNQEFSSQPLSNTCLIQT